MSQYVYNKQYYAIGKYMSLLPYVHLSGSLWRSVFQQSRIQRTVSPEEMWNTDQRDNNTNTTTENALYVCTRERFTSEICKSLISLFYV